MEIADIELGFPDIDGYVMHTRIDCHSPEAIMLWFHSHTRDLSAMINIQVFLIGASMRNANVEIKPFFPPMKSYSIQKKTVQGIRKNLLNIVFERGGISFFFEKTLYVKSIQPFGQIPSEIEKKQVRK